MYRSTNTSVTPKFKKFPLDERLTLPVLFEQLTADQPEAFLFESADNVGGKGRYSYLGFDPAKRFVFEAGAKENPLEILRHFCQEIEFHKSPELPPFQGGFVGYFSYEVGRHFEDLNLPLDGAKIPEGIFFLPQQMVAIDHNLKELFLIATTQEALERLEAKFRNVDLSLKKIKASDELDRSDESAAHEDEEARLLEGIAMAQERIKAGEIFQVVLSRGFQRKTNLSPLELYARLRLASPSPYMFFLKFADFCIAGASPETQVKIQDRQVMVRPIAGTRRRGRTPLEDLELAEELSQDPKELAEHQMLVDLARNDVGRVAKPGTVRVSQHKDIQKFSHVMHMVSEVRGEQSEDKDLFDVFQASFPAGTLSGAPKVRAMKIIAELEAKPRDIYGGAVGYFGLDGNMDLAIAIRTMLIKDGTVTFRTGAGIVHDSQPNLEHKECLNKAQGILTALQ